MGRAHQFSEESLVARVSTARCASYPESARANIASVPLAEPEVSQAVQALRAGALVAFPTETVYGIGADASNDVAVRRIFEIKGRPHGHPLIVHIADASAAREWCDDFPKAAQVLADAFWPGPLTLVLRRNHRASDGVTGGLSTVALRVPGHPTALALLKAFEGGIAAPSANRFGAVSPTTAQHVIDDFGGEGLTVLDGGPCSVGVESTIVDLSTGSARLLRSGGVSIEALEAALRQSLHGATDGPRVPGMCTSHYAPRARVRIVAALDLPSALRLEPLETAVIAPLGTVIPPRTSAIFLGPAPEDYARGLYGALRRADAVASVLMVVPPPLSGVGLAVFDRLTKAAAPRDQPVLEAATDG